MVSSKCFSKDGKLHTMKFGGTAKPRTNTHPLESLSDEYLQHCGVGRTLSILGSTGSIGTQALQVLRHLCSLSHTSLYDADAPIRVRALSAGRNSLELLAQQAVETRAELIATSGTEQDRITLQELIQQHSTAHGLSGYTPQIICGENASSEAASCGADIVLNGITGSIGLRPTLAALSSGAHIALANKESLIAGGALVRQAVDQSPHEQPLIPVDSEHSALAQALNTGHDSEIERLILTASGGPFRGMTKEQLQHVTPEQALAHPTWDMGKVVTTNSASMVNKALEVLEAHYLFGVDLDHIDVTVHPQSVVHSMVQFIDGTTIAQASPPTMLLPIALGLTWPYRIPRVAPACNWNIAQKWTFEPLDEEAFPAVRIIKDAGRRGGTLPTVFNAANEEAVEAFHEKKISFTAMIDTVQKVLDEHESSSAYCSEKNLTLDSVLEAERWARIRAGEILAQ